MLVDLNQGNYFENATACSKRMRKTLVATQLYFILSFVRPYICRLFHPIPKSHHPFSFSLSLFCERVIYFQQIILLHLSSISGKIFVRKINVFFYGVMPVNVIMINVTVITFKGLHLLKKNAQLLLIIVIILLKWLKAWSISNHNGRHLNAFYYGYISTCFL